MTATAVITLAEFLLARIAEDEAVARAVLEAVDQLSTEPRQRWHERGDRLYITSSISIGLLPAYAHHAARHDPARVLAECEAKRRIVEAHPLTTDVVPVWTGSTPGYACDNCARLSKADPRSIVEDIGPCDTLTALAAVHADHPDYRSEWAPS